jgi:CRISPR-associated protein Cmr1
MRKKLDPPSFSKSINEIAKQNRGPNLVTQIRHYKLITPLFGGGVEAGVNDEVTPISGKAIRGQLRFWWRATCGVGTLSDMKKAEDAIWGAASTKKRKAPSAVTVEVIDTIKKGNKREAAFTLEKNRKGHLQPAPSRNVAQYAAFPLLPDKEERRNPGWVSKNIWCDIEFTVQLKYQKEIDVAIENETFVIDVGAEIHAALWAWETFGGIGARTRRGFGALQLLTIDGKRQLLRTVAIFKEDIRKELAKQLADGRRDESVPHLLPDSPISFTKNKRNDSIIVWKELIDKLQDFRQSPRVQRENIFNGRSDWPEPDAIRTMTTNASFREPEHPVEERFPRAVFGLPIGFKFKDEDSNDPPETFLEGREKSRNAEAISRLASPLVLRPVACADGVIGLALILQAPRIPPDGVHLYYKQGRRRVGHHSLKVTLTAEEAKSINPIRKQLTKLRTVADNDPDLPLKAFLKFVEE